jgi:hypothetical protein
LAVELSAQLSGTQQIPRGSFAVGLAAPQFANTLGWNTHGASIAGLSPRGESSSARSVRNPSPVPRRLEKTPSRDTLPPRERAGPARGRELPQREGESCPSAKERVLPLKMGWAIP